MNNMKKRWYQLDWRQLFIRLTFVLSVIAAVLAEIDVFQNFQKYGEKAYWLMLAPLIAFCGVWAVYGIVWILWSGGRWVYKALLKGDEE